MNKKPLLLRAVVALMVIAVFVISLFPLTERDFYDTFRSLWKDVNDPVLTQVEMRARELQAATPGMYPSAALEEVAKREKVNFVDRVDGKQYLDNRDVLAEVRKLTAASIRRGLDLAGGAEFVMRIIPDEPYVRAVEEAAGDSAKLADLQRGFDTSRDRAIEILRLRMEKNRIFEVEIYPMGSDMISLRVPVVSNDEKVRMLNLVKMSAQLRFALVAENNADLVASYAADPNFRAPGYSPLTDAEGRVFFVANRTEMHGRDISYAQPVSDEFGQRSIALRFNAKGAVDFGKVTTNNVGRELAIMLDDTLYCAPRINEPIMGGNASISGNFSQEDLRDISDALMAGSMQYKLTEEAVFDTDPTLGADNVRNGVFAGIAALVVVFLFMVFYYRFGGLIASIALGANVVMILGALAAFNQTLTLPGIAGIVLTMGMAVDINVLIFERLREEQRTGKSLVASLDAAYSRVLPVIIDAYLTAFFTAFILLNVGTGAVKGFAITMLIGVFTSVFCGVFLTRLCFDTLVQRNPVTRFCGVIAGMFGRKSKEDWHLAKLTLVTLVPADARINYLRFWKQSLIIAAVLFLGTAAIFAVRGDAAFSIDFTGGTMVTFDYDERVPSAEVAGTLSQAGYGDAKVTYKTSISAGDSTKVEILIRNSDQAGAAATDAAGNSLGKEIEVALNSAFPQAHFSGGQESVVSGLVGWEFTKRAILAIGLAFIGIALYISVRYEFSYAMAALVAMIFDVTLAVGVFLATGREISLVVVAAALTVIGYSINDKIVIFDRIRENLRLRKDLTYMQLINMSINQTLARTLLTSVTTALVLAVLLIFGGIAINDFVLVMLLGVVIGTVSSIFQACPLVAMWHRRRVGVREDNRIENADYGDN